MVKNLKTNVNISDYLRAFDMESDSQLNAKLWAINSS